jgi:hypothetical protein
MLRLCRHLEGVMTYQLDPLGISPCPECGHPAMFAWDAAMDLVALDPDPRPGGEWTLTEDPNHIPWCAPVPAGTQFAFDDVLFSLHACPLAEVIPLTARTRTRQAGANRRYA